MPDQIRPWRLKARPNQIPPDSNWRVFCVLAGRGWGKALALDTPIPTPSGWSAMGKLDTGDKVFDENGQVCTVTATHDLWAEEAYRLTFSGGATLDACADHRWVTWTHPERKAYLRSAYEDSTRLPQDWPTWRARHRCRYLGELRVSTDALGPRVRTTREIVDTLTQGKRGDTNHSISVAKALQLPETDLPIDPYVLGFWLGDGTSNSSNITIGSQDADEVIGLIRACGEKVRPLPSAPITYCVGFRERARGVNGGDFASNGSLHSRLKKLNLFYNKHIPESYLRSSVNQRLALLQGLMDSDGYIDGSSGHVEFCSITRALADGVVELACSLGQKPVLAEGRATLNGRDCGPKYRVTWRPTTAVFRLSRKKDKIRPLAGQAFRSLHRMIVKAEQISAQPMRCITVDSPNHMYLAGEQMIPTHNTWCASNWIAEQATTRPNTHWGVVAPTWTQCARVSIEGHSGIRQALDADEIRDYEHSTGIMRLVNGSTITAFSADRADRLHGYQFDGVWIDELDACFTPVRCEVCDVVAVWEITQQSNPNVVDYACHVHLGDCAAQFEGAPLVIQPVVKPDPFALWHTVNGSLKPDGRIYVTTSQARDAGPNAVLQHLIDRASQGLVLNANFQHIVVRTGNTFDNAPNLSPRTLEELRRRYGWDHPQIGPRA